jgi:hypothetical protein
LSTLSAAILPLAIRCLNNLILLFEYGIPIEDRSDDDIVDKPHAEAFQRVLPQVVSQL